MWWEEGEVVVVMVAGVEAGEEVVEEVMLLLLLVGWAVEVDWRSWLRTLFRLKEPTDGLGCCM